MAYTLAQLKTELQSDPKGLGYAAPIAAGDDTAVAALVNSTYAGVGTVWRSSVPVADFLAALVWSEVSTFTQTQWEAFSVMLIPLRIDASQVNVRNFFAGLFTGKTVTLQNLTAAAKVTAPSRAQELWGDTAVVSVADIGYALRG